jgi:hypothetical protein
MAVPFLGPNEVMAQSMGTPVYLGVIAATTTKNNADTAVPFLNTGDGLAGLTLLIHASAACYILPDTSLAATVTTANGVPVAADERVIIQMTPAHKSLAAVGTANVSVWKLI